jgi:hypothetical protein
VDGSSTEFGLRAARKLVEAKDHEWPPYVERLRRNRELSVVTRQLNQLLDHPEHRPLAIGAFKRIGLWHDDLVMPRRMAISEFGHQLASEVRGGEVPMQDRLVDEMAHLLEMDEPMAAAGAELSGLHVKGETEQALERATRLESPAHPKK